MLVTPTTATIASDVAVSDNAVFAGITDTVPFAADVDVGVTVTGAATGVAIITVSITAVFLVAIAATAAGSQSTVNGDTPVVFGVRPDLLYGDIAVM